ncbi:unnamed protein product, partial [Rotaria sp. Silwood2]
MQIWHQTVMPTDSIANNAGILGPSTARWA